LPNIQYPQILLLLLLLLLWLKAVAIRRCVAPGPFARMFIRAADRLIRGKKYFFYLTVKYT
jgi:hypothetical protein